MLRFFISGSACAAKTSHKEIVSFVNDDKNLVCNGKDVKWFLPNGTRILKSSDKYQIEDSEDESVLTVKKINPMLSGIYKCLSYASDIEENFQLKIYCELLNYK